MVLREDQQKVKALLTEAITVLCKNGLSYADHFSVEGLLGITLDDEEVFLININETISGDGSTQAKPVQPIMPPHHQRSPIVTPTKANRARVRANYGNVGSRGRGGQQGFQNRKRSLEQDFPKPPMQGAGSTPSTPQHTTSPPSSYHGSPGTPGTPQQYTQPQQQQPDSDQPPAKRLHESEQDGGDLTLEDGQKIKTEPGGMHPGEGGDDMGNDWDSAGMDNTDPNNQAMAALEAMVHSRRLRSEANPGSSGCDERTNTADVHHHEEFEHDVAAEQYVQTSERVHVMPAHEEVVVHEDGSRADTSSSGGHLPQWHSSGYVKIHELPRNQQLRFGSVDRGSAILAELQSRLIHDQVQDRVYISTETKSESEVVEKRYRPPRPQGGPADVLEMQRCVLLQPGCVVSTRVILRKFPKFRINGLLGAMQAMSDADHYVGELGQIQSHVRVFYKCPPQLIQPEALEKYGVTLEEYVFQFEQNPQPARGGPSDWESYVTKLVERAPYNAQLFPLEKMGLDGGALKRLRKFREQMPARK